MIAGSLPAARDPLLAIVRFLLGVMMALLVVVTGALLVAVPLMISWQDRVMSKLVELGAPPEAAWAVVGLMLLSAAAAVLGFFFFRHLYRIIDSVGGGDPFVPANADRLRAMAWISLAVHVVAIPMSGLGEWLARVTHEVRFQADIPFAGLFLALVLFILARVFREGTRMREDLEGTV